METVKEKILGKRENERFDGQVREKKLKNYLHSYNNSVYLHSYGSRCVYLQIYTLTDVGSFFVKNV